MKSMVSLLRNFLKSSEFIFVLKCPYLNTLSYLLAKLTKYVWHLIGCNTYNATLNNFLEFHFILTFITFAIVIIKQ